MKNDVIKINRRQPKHREAKRQSQENSLKNMKRKNGNKYLYVHTSVRVYVCTCLTEKARAANNSVSAT